MSFSNQAQSSAASIILVEADPHFREALALALHQSLHCAIRATDRGIWGLHYYNNQFPIMVVTGFQLTPCDTFSDGVTMVRKMKGLPTPEKSKWRGKPEFILNSYPMIGLDRLEFDYVYDRAQGIRALRDYIVGRSVALLGPAVLRSVEVTS